MDPDPALGCRDPKKRAVTKPVELNRYAVDVVRRVDTALGALVKVVTPDHEEWEEDQETLPSRFAYAWLSQLRNSSWMPEVSGPYR